MQVGPGVGPCNIIIGDQESKLLIQCTSTIQVGPWNIILILD